MLLPEPILLHILLVCLSLKEHPSLAGTPATRTYLQHSGSAAGTGEDEVQGLVTLRVSWFCSVVLQAAPLTSGQLPRPVGHWSAGGWCQRES